MFDDRASPVSVDRRGHERLWQYLGVFFGLMVVGRAVVVAVEASGATVSPRGMVVIFGCFVAGAGVAILLVLGFVMSGRWERGHAARVRNMRVPQTACLLLTAGNMILVAIDSAVVGRVGSAWDTWSASFGAGTAGFILALTTLSILDVLIRAARVTPQP